MVPLSMILSGTADSQHLYAKQSARDFDQLKYHVPQLTSAKLITMWTNLQHIPPLHQITTGFASFSLSSSPEMPKLGSA